MSDRLVIFTLEDCIHCISLKMRLNELSITFNEINVDKHPELWNKIVDETGNESLPLIFISEENSDIGNLYIPNVSFNNEDEIINIIKSKFL